MRNTLSATESKLDTIINHGNDSLRRYRRFFCGGVGMIYYNAQMLLGVLLRNINAQI